MMFRYEFYLLFFVSISGWLLDIFLGLKVALRPASGLRRLRNKAKTELARHQKSRAKSCIVTPLARTPYFLWFLRFWKQLCNIRQTMASILWFLASVSASKFMYLRSEVSFQRCVMWLHVGYVPVAKRGYCECQFLAGKQKRTCHWCTAHCRRPIKEEPRMLTACDLFFSFARSLFRWFLRLVVLCLSGCSTPGHANPAIGSGAKLMGPMAARCWNMYCSLWIRI